ncbi:MAG: acyl-CoA dehydrogenase family protein, partial [Chloroflexota bacterium]|nr:acyl-CoA dehydrogenase family protein [Chloroflexota bacterium]
IQFRSALPDPLIEAMSEANLFQLFVPGAIGGPQTDPITAFRAVEELSKADGSVGWCSLRSKRDIHVCCLATTRVGSRSIRATY